MAKNGAIRVEAFYNCWKSPVYQFCCAFLGDEGVASESTARAFFEYIRQHGTLDLAAVPPGLLGSTLAVVQSRCRIAAKPNGETLNLAEAILLLSCEQRAVFILRSVLGVSVDVISHASGLESNRVRAPWFQAAMRLRELLPRKLFEERHQ